MTRLLLLLLVCPVFAQKPPIWRINGLPPGQLPVLYAYSENTLTFDPCEDATGMKLTLAIKGGTVTQTNWESVSYDRHTGPLPAISFIPDIHVSIRHHNGQMSYNHHITLLVMQQQYDNYSRATQNVVWHEIVLDSILLPPPPSISIQYVPSKPPYLQLWASLKPDSSYAASCPKDAQYYLQGGLVLGQDSVGHWDTLDVRIHAERERQNFFCTGQYPNHHKRYRAYRLVLNPPTRIDSRGRPQPAGVKPENLVWDKGTVR